MALLGHDAVLIGHIGCASRRGVLTLHDLGLHCIRPAKSDEHAMGDVDVGDVEVQVQVIQPLVCSSLPD